MVTGHLRIEDDGHRWQFRLSEPSGDTILWFERLDQPLGQVSTLDVALTATILAWMRSGVSQVALHGTVSRTLLMNLEELQLVWSRWRPQVYSQVEFLPDNIIDDVPEGVGAVSAFSGGVDATFTVMRHALEERNPWGAELHEVVMIHGFDIPLDTPEDFDLAVARGERLLATTGLPVARIRTNAKEINQKWEDAFGLLVSSVLLTFAGKRRWGLIGSSEPYDALVLPWGSTPIQDWMASTGAMSIRHDGAGFSRSDKVAALGEWPDALNELRVCWAGERRYRNCGRCEKCIRTMLNFQAVGLDVPGCFERQASLEEIRRVDLGNDALEAEFVSLLTSAGARGINGDWVRAVRSAIRRSRVRRSRAWRFTQRVRRKLRSFMV
jgi:hypothetical protein